jgi:2-dehydropantoate 2-reductase
MNVVVIGAGAVGGYFGGRLAQAGADVSFYVRDKRFKQLRERGLQVRSTHGDFTLNPHLVTEMSELPDADIVLLTVKGYHLPGTFPVLDALVARGAVVLPLLNGVNHIDTLVQRYEAAHVLGGACYIESTLTDDGDIAHTSPMHDIVFGALPDDSVHGSGGPGRAMLEQLQNAFVAANVNSTLSADVLADMWQKYVFLTSFSAVTAAVRGPIGKVLQDEIARNLLIQLVKEVEAIARAKGVGLADDLVNQIVQRLYHVSPSMTSSLHRDLEKGMPLELDELQGAAVHMGRQVGVDTPGFAVIYALLHPYASGVSGR